MANPLDGISQIIAIHSAKGGVGKSTVAANLAVALAQKGARVGLLDADVHGPSGSIMLGNGEWPDPGKDENTILPIKAHDIKFMSMANIVNKKTPLIWRGAMVHSVLTQFLKNVVWGELDYLFIDMPPGTGDALLTIGQTVSLAGVIAVSSPQELSLVDTIRGINSFRQLKVPVLGLIENMSYFVCDQCEDRAFLFGQSGAEYMAEELGFPLLGKIPLEPGVCESGDTGKPFSRYALGSAAARALEGIISRLLPILEESVSTGHFNLKWRDMEWHERSAEPKKQGQTAEGIVKSLWQVSRDELGIQWQQGDTTVFSVRELRMACPCAVCVDEWTGKPLLNPEQVPQDIGLQSIQSVGRYALAPVFSDGHKTGIFHFDKLKALAEKKATP